LILNQNYFIIFILWHTETADQ